MASQGALCARMIAFVATVAVCIALALTASGGGSLASVLSDEIAVIALDANAVGNGPRSVAGIDDCVSVEVGEPVEVDVVIAAPGVPLDRGISAYQFTLVYEASVVSVQAENNEMLLAQAPGSSVISIADPKPDTNGYYVSWGIDFGPLGIEPEGASEVGSGVVSRVTLMAQTEGSWDLFLTDVLLIDDASEEIVVGGPQAAMIVVGGPCPGEDISPTGTPKPTAVPDPGPTPTPTPAPATTPISSPGTIPLAPTGGPPGAAAGIPWWVIGGGLALLVGGLTTLASSMRVGRRRG